jgi:hypothetical protein
MRDDVAQELQRLGTEIKHILHIQPAAAGSSAVADEDISSQSTLHLETEESTIHKLRMRCANEMPSIAAYASEAAQRKRTKTPTTFCHGITC